MMLAESLPVEYRPSSLGNPVDLPRLGTFYSVAVHDGFRMTDVGRMDVFSLISGAWQEVTVALEFVPDIRGLCGRPCVILRHNADGSREVLYRWLLDRWRLESHE